MKTRVSVLGLGRMGSALARALIKAGHPSNVWNRSPDKAQPLAALGATVAAKPQDAVAGSDVVIVNVTDYAVSRALLRDAEVAAGLRGKLVVELSSGTPREARDAARWAETQGAFYLDGAILATPDIIGSDAATILVSGPLAAFTRHQETLATLGNVRHVGEDPGTAAALEAVGLSQLWGGLFAALHAIAIAEAEDIPFATLAQQWQEGTPVIEGLVTDLIKRSAGKRFAADAETLSTVGVHAHALRHLADISRLHDLDPGLTRTYEARFERAIAAGHLDDDFAAMTQFTKIAPEAAPRAAGGKRPSTHT